MPVSDTQQSTAVTEKPINNRSKHIQVMLKENQEILRKLDAVRKTKAYEMLKYNQIQNMDASMIGQYLHSEQRHQTSSIQSTEYENLRQRIRQEVENKAAFTIQQYFREILLRRNIERRTKRWKNECPTTRLLLIEELSGRLAQNRAPLRADLSVIKLRLMEWKRYRKTSIQEFEKRQLLMFQLNRNLQFLEDYISTESNTSQPKN